MSTRLGQIVSNASKRVSAPKKKSDKQGSLFATKLLPGDKGLIKNIIQKRNFADYGITNTTLTEEDVDRLSPDELYEILYSGDPEIWNNSIFEEEVEKEYNFISDLTREINVVKSIYNCPRLECGYDRIIVRQEQKSAGDESMTTSYRCTRCGYAWSSRG